MLAGSLFLTTYLIKSARKSGRRSSILDHPNAGCEQGLDPSA